MPREFSSSRGVFGSLFFFFIRLFGWVFLGWALVITISLISTLYFGEDASLHYLNQLLRGVSAYFILSSKSGVYHLQGFDLLTKIQILFSFLEKYLDSMYQSLSTITFITKNQDITEIVTMLSKSIEIILIISEVFLIRIVSLFLSLLLVGVLMSVGFVDGLVQRYIRKISGGRESSLIYHQAKYFSAFFVFFSMFFYLIFPLNIRPEMFFVPAGCLSAYFLMVSVKMFKKTV